MIHFKEFHEDYGIRTANDSMFWIEQIPINYQGAKIYHTKMIGLYLEGRKTEDMLARLFVSTNSRNQNPKYPNSRCYYIQSGH